MNGVFNVYEIKWNFKKKRLPKMFKKTYPVENFEIIDKSNFEKKYYYYLYKECKSSSVRTF